MEILTSGKNFIKKSYDSLMAKLKRIEEENFLIPKKKEEESKSEEAESSYDEQLVDRLVIASSPDFD